MLEGLSDSDEVTLGDDLVRVNVGKDPDGGLLWLSELGLIIDNAGGPEIGSMEGTGPVKLVNKPNELLIGIVGKRDDGLVAEVCTGRDGMLTGKVDMTNELMRVGGAMLLSHSVDPLITE